MARSGNSRKTIGSGPWKGVRDLADPFAVPPNYLLGASNMYIPDPTGGSGIYQRPGFRRLNAVPAITSDAIIRPRVLWTNGYETEGQVFRLGQNPATPEPGDFSLVGEVTGDFTFVATGGRDGGGHVLTVESAPGATQADNVGNYMWLPLASGESPPRGAGQHHAFNYFGEALPRPHNAIGFGANTGSGHFFPAVVLQIGVDLKVRVMKPSVDGGGNAVLTQLGDTSTVDIPADGWWALEPQAFVAPSGNTAGGFVIAKLYTEDGPAEGETVVFPLNIDLEGDGIHGYAWGSEVVRRNSVGISGIGIDDSVVYGPYGLVKRWIGDTLIGVAIPSAAGDETNSVITFDSQRGFGTPPQTIGALVTHGSVDRWRNVTGTPARAIDELTVGKWWFGQTSVFTDAWLYGPNAYALFVPANYQNTAAIGAIGAIPRNTFYDAAGDLYRVAVGRSSIAQLEGVFPYARTTAAWVKGTLGSGDASADGGGPGTFQLASEKATPPEFSVVGQHMNDGIDQPIQHDFRPRIKSGATEATLPVCSATRHSSDLLAVAVRWQTILGYTIAPYLFLENDPATLSRFSPTTIPLLQVGAVGDFTAFDDAHPAPGVGERWIQFEVCEIGFDFAYHRAIVELLEHAPFAPIAGFTLATGTDLPARHLSVADASVDWDGTVVTRRLDWGDGSPVEDLPAAFADRLSHDYAIPGVYTITLTVTDNDGLTDSISTSVNAYVVNTPPVAAFETAVDGGDISGLTINFTDVSIDDGTIAEWDWDFGDGSPHGTTQNPTHVYAAPGTYTVVLTVTDDGGEAAQPALTDSDSQSLDVALTPPDPGTVTDDLDVEMLDGFDDGANQSNKRWFYTNESNSLFAGGVVEENATDMYWDAGPQTHSLTAWRAFEFNLNGQALPAYDTPLFMLSGAHDWFVVTLTSDRRLVLRRYNGGAFNAIAGPTSFQVPASGKFRAEFRILVDAVDPVSWAWLRYNGALTFDLNNQDWTEAAGGWNGFFHGTGLCFGANEYDPSGIGANSGIAGVQWDNVAQYDPGAHAQYDYAGDALVGSLTPTAAGAFNDSGGAAADVVTDDGDTSFADLPAIGSKDTWVGSAVPGSVVTVLGVAPYFYAKNNTTSGIAAPKGRALLYSGGTLVDNGVDLSIGLYTSSIQSKRFWLKLDPFTAAAWTVLALGNAQAGMKYTAKFGAGTATLRTSQIGLNYLYRE